MKRMGSLVFIVFIIIIFNLAACNNAEKLEADLEYDNIKLPNYSMIEYALTYSDKGIYFNDGMDLYYMPRNGDKLTFLEHLIYQDDKPISMDEAGNYSYYQEMPGAHNLTLNMGESLYYTAFYEDIKGNKYYSLNRLNNLGKNREILLKLNYEPRNFLVHKNHILISEYSINNSTRLHIYDSRFNEKTIEVPWDIGEIYAGEQGFNCVGDKKINEKLISCLEHIDFDGNEKILDQINGNISFCSNKYYILISFINNDENKTKSILKNMDGSIIREEKDRDIVFVDDNYYYTESKGDKQIYGRYNLNGSLNAELIPSETLGKMGEAIYSREKDFDSIERIIGDEFLIRQLDRQKGYLIYIMGSFKTGKFRIIDSSALEKWS